MDPARHGSGCTQLIRAVHAIGGRAIPGEASGADAALLFRLLPRIPIMLLFWDEEPREGYDAAVKLLFDETIVEHLDIASIIFLSERIKQLLCGEKVSCRRGLGPAITSPIAGRSADFSKPGASLKR